MDGKMEEVDEALGDNRALDEGGAVTDGAEGGKEKGGRCGKEDGEGEQQDDGEDEQLEGGPEELFEGNHGFKKVMG